MGVIDFKEIPDGEAWESFSSVFLEVMGFGIESPQDRGPDGKKDMIASDHMEGNVFDDDMQALVSCKHFAHSNKSVQEEDEINILERVKGFNCTGFIGVYSTLPSSGLNTRLAQLKAAGDIKDYKIFDKTNIETHLYDKKHEKLVKRFFPESYKKLYDLYPITPLYMPLNCAVCKKDILKELYNHDYSAFLFEVVTVDEQTGVVYIKKSVCVCAGKCEKEFSNNLTDDEKKIITITEIEKLIDSSSFLSYIITLTDGLQNGKIELEASAYDNRKNVIIALCQRVFREVSPEEAEKIKNLLPK